MYTEVKQGDTVIAVFLDGKVVSQKDPKYVEWKNSGTVPVDTAAKKTKKKKAD